jgi:hypothetical protein
MNFEDDGNPRFVLNKPIRHPHGTYFSFSARLYWTKDKPVYSWCIEQFGISDSISRPLSYRWRRQYVNHFEFRDEADAALFRIRWC